MGSGVKIVLGSDPSSSLPSCMPWEKDLTSPSQLYFESHDPCWRGGARGGGDTNCTQHQAASAFLQLAESWALEDLLRKVLRGEAVMKSLNCLTPTIRWGN